MDLVVIAQLITGIATLIVALILVFQLRNQSRQLEVQHLDSDRQLSMESVKMSSRQRELEIVDNNFSELFYKAKFNGLDKLSKLELNKIKDWYRGYQHKLVTEWRLGRMDNSLAYFKIHYRNLFENQSAKEFYLNSDSGMSLREELLYVENNPQQKKGLIKIADEIFEELSRQKIDL